MEENQGILASRREPHVRQDCAYAAWKKDEAPKKEYEALAKQEFQPFEETAQSSRAGLATLIQAIEKDHQNYKWAGAA